MLGSFKIRLLVVIVIVTMVGLIMQSGHSSRQVVEPVLQYIIETNYDLSQELSNYIHMPGKENTIRALPVDGISVLKVPCDFLAIERGYGWYWSSAEGRQEFCPGIHLKVNEDTLVKPILEGEVQDINNGTVTIKHKSNMVSVYGGLKQILVDKKTQISSSNAIGRTGNSFYFEVRGQDGPVNPQSIFK